MNRNKEKNYSFSSVDIKMSECQHLFTFEILKIGADKNLHDHINLLHSGWHLG